jgi:hypothetical protein
MTRLVTRTMVVRCRVTPTATNPWHTKVTARHPTTAQMAAVGVMITHRRSLSPGVVETLTAVDLAGGGNCPVVSTHDDLDL